MESIFYYLLFLSSVLISGIIGHFLVPFLRKFELYSSCGDKRKDAFGQEAPITSRFNGAKTVVTPRMGGLTIVFGFTVISAVLFFLGYVDTIYVITFVTFILFALLGLLDDINDVSGCERKYRMREKLFATVVASIIIVNFLLTYFTDTTINIFGYNVNNIWLAFFMGVVWMTIWWSTTIIDGMDGLAGGLYGIVFLALGIYNILIGTPEAITVSIIAITLSGLSFGYLSKNLPPAKVFMTEVGSGPMSYMLGFLTFVNATLTDANVFSFILYAGILLLLAPISSFAQILYRKFNKGKKLFIVAPIFLHFQAKGYEPQTIVMFYWLITIVLSFLGISVAYA